jgi:hypothetical protein
MSLRLEMLQVARLAQRVLGDSALLVRDFLLKQQCRDGGFKNRDGASDLYYTVFGLEGLIALDIPALTAADDRETLAQAAASAQEFLSSFTELGTLDFVHLCCLARGWAAVGNLDPTLGFLSKPNELVQRIESFRSTDGGFNPMVGSASGTAYGAFLGLGGYQDLGVRFPAPESLAQSLQALESVDGGWMNERPSQAVLNLYGATNATAAAIAVLRNLGATVRSQTGEWLLRQAHPQGGFVAAPNAPVPDLLSTATALHSLSALQVSFKAVQESCLDFVDSLWTSEGAFHGHWGDDHLDCEYTYYGLLALGHLSL